MLREMVLWLLKSKQVFSAVLAGFVVASALSVAFSAHQTRNMYRDLQQLEKDFDDLEHEYEKLLLEQSAWADYTRVDQLAQDRLSMAAPAPSTTVVLP